MKLSDLIHERIVKWRPIRINELLSWAHQSEDNERRITQLEKRNAELKRELADEKQRNRSLETTPLHDNYKVLKRENEWALHIGKRIKWYSEWHKSKGHTHANNVPVGVFDEWAAALLTGVEMKLSELWIAYDFLNDNDGTVFCRGEDLENTFKPYEIADKLNLLEAKLAAIECGDCAKNLLERKCDDLEDG